MDRLTFCIVDVFAEEKYAGNQLAVVRGARSLSDAEMQRIAREMNYSETTFILSEEERDGGYDVRIYKLSIRSRRFIRDHHTGANDKNPTPLEGRSCSIDHSAGWTSASPPWDSVPCASRRKTER